MIFGLNTVSILERSVCVWNRERRQDWLASVHYSTVMNSGVDFLRVFESIGAI
ncbi:MAG: hypothetical protein R6U89_08865 [Dehalococcoidia bacterium]